MAHREWTDILGFIAVLLKFSGIGAVSVKVYILRQQQRLGTDCKNKGHSTLLILVVACLWLLATLMDTSGLLAALSNDVDDIPLETTLKAALLGVWFWQLWGILDRLAKEVMAE